MYKLLLDVASQRVADDESEEEDDREDHDTEEHPLAAGEDAGPGRLRPVHPRVVHFNLIPVTVPLAARHRL